MLHISIRRKPTMPYAADAMSRGSKGAQSVSWAEQRKGHAGKPRIRIKGATCRMLRSLTGRAPHREQTPNVEQ